MVFLDACAQVAEALDLPRFWWESESLSLCVRRIVDGAFVVSSCGEYAWREELSAELDPMQERWAALVESSGVLECLSEE